MTSKELLDIILIIRPNSQVSIHQLDDPYVELERAVILSNYYVVWNYHNNLECPTQDEIDNEINKQNNS